MPYKNILFQGKYIYSLNMALEEAEIFCVIIFILGGPGGEGGHRFYYNSVLLIVKHSL